MLSYEEWLDKKGIKLETKMLKFMDNVPYFLTKDVRVKLMDDLPMEKYSTKFLKEQYDTYVKDKLVHKSLKKVKKGTNIVIANAEYKASIPCYKSDNIIINNVRYKGSIEVNSGIDTDGDTLKILDIDKDNVLHCSSMYQTDILVILEDIIKGK